MKEIFCFFIKGQEFGIYISQMVAIENPHEVVKRDDQPSFVKGMINLHGDDLPLVDTSQRIALPDRETPGGEQKLVIIRSQAGRYAIEADGISEIVSVEDSAISPVPGMFDRGATSYASGVVAKGKTLVLLFDPEGLLSKEQWVEMNKLIDTVHEERAEAERQRIEEERRRKEEARRKREEERAREEEEMKG